MSGLDELVVTLGGQRFEDLWDHVCRYAGLPSSGGVPEVWAFEYYDAVRVDDLHEVVPVDVAAASVLCSGVSRSDLEFFTTERDRLTEWLEPIPVGVPLHQLPHAVVDHICTLPAFDAPGTALLSAVLHRKRPDAIPLIDGHVIDLYRSDTVEHPEPAAFPAIVAAMSADLAGGAALPLALMQLELEKRTGVTVSMLRVADIGIRVSARQQAAARASTPGARR